MSEINDIVKLAVDISRNSVEKYSKHESLETMRNALIEANNGKNHLDFEAIQYGECGKVFRLLTQILSRTIVDGLQGDEYFNTLVQFVNAADGDKIYFEVEDADLFVVSDAANGTSGIRRQRLGGSTSVSIPTTRKVVKFYEEFDRVLAGRVDFNTFITKVSESFRQKLLNDVYALWHAATAEDFGGNTYFPAAGAYDTDTLLELIEHTEAAAGGKQATILCTKKTARLLAPDVQGTMSQNDLYTMGYYGNFYGNPVVVTPQRHKVGTSEFIFDDNTISIIAGDDKPIKCVYEGQPIIQLGNAMDKPDNTQEYMYSEKYGMGIVLAGGNSGIGRYQIV